MKKVLSIVLVVAMLFACVSVNASAATLRNLDLAFVIDTTGSMSDDIDTVKADMLKYLEKLDATGVDYRIAIVDYRDFAERTGDENDYPYMVQLDFTSDAEAITTAINGLDLGYGGDNEETVYSALIDGLSELTWRKAAGKAVILMGDAPALDPEPYTEYTMLDVLKALVTGEMMPVTYAAAPVAGEDVAVIDETAEIEPIGDVVVFAINTTGDSETTECFTEIAEATGGKYYDSSEEESVSEIIEEVIVEIPDIVVDEEPEEPEEPADDDFFSLILKFFKFLFELHEIFSGIVNS